MKSIMDRAPDAGEENLDEDRAEQRLDAAEAAGSAVLDDEVELGSYDYYKNIHGRMDSTPEGLQHLI